MLKAVIFDADGVIIDSERIWDLAQEEFLRRRGIPYERERVKLICTANSPVGAIKALQEIYGFQGDPEQMSEERLAIVRGHYQKSGIPLVPGFTEFHEKVKDRYLTAVATAMEQGLMDMVVGKLGLRKYFGDHIYSIAEIGYVPKPNPDIFLYAAKKLGVKPGDCLVIEDSPNGIEAARRAGMRCAALTTTFGRERLEGADQVCGGFEEIDLTPNPFPTGEGE
jgi:HAD superfamily hydrolase (TIGR01509 family)